MRLVISLILVSLFVTQSSAGSARALWSTYQGNAAHTGVLPMTVNPEKFHVLWTKNLAEKTQEHDWSVTFDAAVTDKMIYVSTHNTMTSVSTLSAVQVSTGDIAWQIPLDYSQGITAPAYANNKIFIAQGGVNQPNLRAYDAESGKLLFLIPISGMMDYGTPVADDSHVYVQSGSFHNINIATGRANKVFDGGLVNTPVINNNLLYTFNDNRQLLIEDVTTGKTIDTIAAPEMRGISMEIVSPVLDEKNKVLFYCNRWFDDQLYAYDLPNSKTKWMAAEKFNGQPVLVDNTIYITQPDDALAAVDADSGKIQWKWKPVIPEEINHFPIPVATSNVIFVPGKRNTYAVSIATHQTVWQIPKSGRLVLGDKLLFIIGRDSTVTAIGLN